MKLDEQTLRKIENDANNIKEAMKQNNLKKGWHTDFADAPTDTYLLLQSGSRDAIYRATLVKDKNGNIQRGVCDTPWLDGKHGKDETQENFVRDGIKAWYMPNNWMDYFDEVWNAVALTVRPQITSSRKFPDGTVRAVLKNKMTGEREFIEWHEPV